MEINRTNPKTSINTRILSNAFFLSSCFSNNQRTNKIPATSCITKRDKTKLIDRTISNKRITRWLKRLFNISSSAFIVPELPFVKFFINSFIFGYGFTSVSYLDITTDSNNKIFISFLIVLKWCMLIKIKLFKINFSISPEFRTHNPKQMLILEIDYPAK